MHGRPPAVNPVDLSAISMLVFASIALAVIASIIYRIFKNHNAAPNPENKPTETLSKKRPKSKKPPKKSQPWEKDADWWKK